MPGLFADVVRPQLSQGDVYPDGWTAGESSLIVLSNDCDIDKSPIVLAIKIAPDATTTASLLGDIKRGRVYHALYLEGAVAGGWANFRTIGPADRTRLSDNLGKRAYSMTDDGRVVLATKMFSFLTRTLPSAPATPLSPSP